MAAVVAMVLTGNAALAAQSSPRWMGIPPGSAVRVTMETDEAFDAIWLGRDGDRAVFERLDPHETISVPIDSVRCMGTRKGSSSPDAASFGALGAVAGFLGGLGLFVLGYRGR